MKMKFFSIFVIVASAAIMCNGASLEPSEEGLEPLENIFTEHLPKHVPKLGLSPGELKVFAGHSFQLLKSKCPAVMDETVTQLNKYVAKLITKTDLSQAQPNEVFKGLLGAISNCTKTKMSDKEKFERKQKFFKDVFGPESGIPGFFDTTAKQNVKGFTGNEEVQGAKVSKEDDRQDIATPPQTVFYPVEEDDSWGPFGLFRNAFKMIRNFFAHLFDLEEEKVVCCIPESKERIKRDVDGDEDGQQVATKVQRERGDGAGAKLRTQQPIVLKAPETTQESLSTDEEKDDNLSPTEMVKETSTFNIQDVLSTTTVNVQEADVQEAATSTMNAQEATTSTADVQEAATSTANLQEAATSTTNVQEAATSTEKVEKISPVATKVEKSKVPNDKKMEKVKIQAKPADDSGKQAFLKLVDGFCQVFGSHCEPSQVINFKSAAKELTQLVLTDQSGLNLVSQHYLTPDFFKALEKCL